jgi:hypothetical protein
MSVASFASALPYAAWSSGTFATIPMDAWPNTFASLQSLKGHIQEYPGCQSFDAFVQPNSGGSVLIHCYTTWDTPEQLEAFLERGYTLERMLADLGLSVERSVVLEKVF